VLGYMAATFLPAAFEYDAINAAGMMSVTAGVLLVIAMVVSPRHGLVTRALRQRALARSVALDDLLATMYRADEATGVAPSMVKLAQWLPRRECNRAVAAAVKSGFIVQKGTSLGLTASGRVEAEAIIRRHRLWETYLVDEANLPADRVHEQAHQLEHVRLEPPGKAATDPHGRPIPYREENDRNYE